MMRCATTLIVSVCLLACAERRASTVPFTLEHGLVFLEVEFPDHGPVLALLDTGANASAVDGRVASDLPVLGMSEVTGTTGSIEVENVRLDGLGLGSLRLPSLHATRRDLSGLLAPQGRTVGMILGSDALMELAVTIDFAASRLEVSTRPAEGLPEGVTMRMDNGIPAIEGNLAGLDLWLRIDTAASLFETEDIYVNIPTHAWEALRARHPDLTPSTHFTGSGADGRTFDLPVAAVPGARLAGQEFDRVFVIVQPEVGYFADPQAKGFVSNNFLRRLGRVTLDYPSGRLRPGS
jgi:hypothetical protein